MPRGRGGLRKTGGEKGFGGEDLFDSQIRALVGRALAFRVGEGSRHVWACLDGRTERGGGGHV